MNTNLAPKPVGVRTAVAVYPGCGASGVWSSSLPLLMLLGEKDDIAPPPPAMPSYSPYRTVLMYGSIATRALDTVST